VLHTQIKGSNVPTCRVGLEHWCNSGGTALCGGGVRALYLWSRLQVQNLTYFMSCYNTGQVVNTRAPVACPCRIQVIRHLCSVVGKVT